MPLKRAEGPTDILRNMTLTKLNTFDTNIIYVGLG